MDASCEINPPPDTRFVPCIENFVINGRLIMRAASSIYNDGLCLRAKVLRNRVIDDEMSRRQATGR